MALGLFRAQATPGCRAAALVLAVAAAGCGGDSAGGDRGSGGSVTQEEREETEFSAPERDRAAVKDRTTAQKPRRTKSKPRTKRAAEKRKSPTVKKPDRPEGARDRDPSPPRADRGREKRLFVARADRLCRAFQIRSRALQERPTSTREEQLTYLASVRRLLQRTLDRLRALDTPEDGQHKVLAYLRSVDRTVDTLELLRDAIERGDAARARSLQERLVRLSRSGKRSAGSYGFRVCGSAG